MILSSTILDQTPGPMFIKQGQRKRPILLIQEQPFPINITLDLDPQSIKAQCLEVYWEFCLLFSTFYLQSID